MHDELCDSGTVLCGTVAAGARLFRKRSALWLCFSHELLIFGCLHCCARSSCRTTIEVRNRKRGKDRMKPFIHTFYLGVMIDDKVIEKKDKQ